MVSRSRDCCTGAELYAAAEAVGITRVAFFTAGRFLDVADFGAADVVVCILSNGLSLRSGANGAGEGLYAGITARRSCCDLAGIPGVSVNSNLSVCS